MEGQYLPAARSSRKTIVFTAFADAVNTPAKTRSGASNGRSKPGEDSGVGGRRAMSRASESQD